MGEQIYTVYGRFDAKWGEWDEVEIQFSEMDDDTACLCTFPHNFNEKLDAEHVRSLAMLGAAVVLAHQGELKETVNFLPHCLPQWIRDEIKRIVDA